MKNSPFAHGWNSIKTALVLGAIALMLLAGIGGWATASAQPGQPPKNATPVPAATAAPGEVVQQDAQTAITTPSRGTQPGSQPSVSGDIGTMALGASSFSYRAYWGYKNGGWQLTLYNPRITANSRVFVSFSEIDAYGNRFVGAAHYSIYSIAPRNGAVTIRVFIDWGSPLRTVVDYLVIQPY